jgi:hypothetical protein
MGSFPATSMSLLILDTRRGSKKYHAFPLFLTAFHLTLVAFDLYGIVIGSHVSIVSFPFVAIFALVLI